MNDLLNPSPDALVDLVLWVTDLLTGLPFVHEIRCFGSFARGNWDCWSDIDLLVVTDTRDQFLDLLGHLEAIRPIVHRNHFVAFPDSGGAHILGILFAGCSVFHCVDLNLYTFEEARMLGRLDRFGSMKVLYRVESQPTAIEARSLVVSEPEDPGEATIKVAIHFTKKAAKQVLRGIDAQADLRHHASALRQIMNAYPPDLVIGGRQIGLLAQSYLEIAQLLER